jgi:hypothetical protein
MKPRHLHPFLSLVTGLTLTLIPLRAAETGVAKKDEVRRVDFGLLASYNYSAMLRGVNSGGAAKFVISEQLPEVIEKLDNRKVAITGYMLPLRWKKGRVTEFFVMRDTQSCCYGQPPKINELIRVRSREGFEAKMDTPLVFQGTLLVSPTITDGLLESVYAMECDKIALL